MRRIYGKITTFPKKGSAFTRWLDGETFDRIARTAGVAEATAQIYVIDMIADGVAGKEINERLVTEMNVNAESIERVFEFLCRSSVTLREIRDNTQLSYNQIRAVIALFLNGYNL